MPVTWGLRGAGAALLAIGAAAAAAPPPDFAELAAAQAAVVVSIRTVTTRPPVRDDDDDGEDDSDAAAAPAATPRERVRPLRGLASGFVIASDGVILTSAHVVRGVIATTVKLSDGREMIARVVASDEASDVAVLQVAATGLPAARLGSSATLAPGDWVAAIGAPFGLEASLTAGVVSARRDLPGHFGVSFLQTDVAMNPGNSGGPLFDARGEVVGLNSMSYTTSGGYMGVSFSLPIESVLDVLRQLRSHGRVVRGRLGVRVQEATPLLSRAFGRPTGGGALVIAAASATDPLRAGDIVLGAANGPVLDYAALQQLVATTAPGSRLRLAVWRDGRTVPMEVEILPVTALAEPAPTRAVGGDALGLVLVEADTGVRDKLEGRAGLDVVESYGPALRAGIGAGDRILAISGRPVPDRRAYAAAIAPLRIGDTVALLVLRERRRAWVALQRED
jgi:serine protease Do